MRALETGLSESGGTFSPPSEWPLFVFLNFQSHPAPASQSVAISRGSCSPQPDSEGAREGLGLFLFLCPTQHGPGYLVTAEPTSGDGSVCLHPIPALTRPYTASLNSPLSSTQNTGSGGTWVPLVLSTKQQWPWTSGSASLGLCFRSCNLRTLSYDLSGGFQQ